jgi:hypothetical protein
MFKIVLVDFNTGKRTETLTYDTERKALEVAVLANKGARSTDADHYYTVEKV